MLIWTFFDSTPPPPMSRPYALVLHFAVPPSLSLYNIIYEWSLTVWASTLWLEPVLFFKVNRKRISEDPFRFFDFSILCSGSETRTDVQPFWKKIGFYTQKIATRNTSSRIFGGSIHYLFSFTEQNRKKWTEYLPQPNKLFFSRKLRVSRAWLIWSLIL